MHAAHRHQRRLVAVAADDVGELGRVGREPLPAVRLRHLARIALVEAHAGEHGAAGRLDARGEAHAVGVGLDLRAGDGEQRDGRAAAVEQAGDLLHLDQAELRRREHDEIDAVDPSRVAPLEGADIGFADRVAAAASRARPTTSSSRCASGVMPTMWNSATEP